MDTDKLPPSQPICVANILVIPIKTLNFVATASAVVVIEN